MGIACAEAQGQAVVSSHNCFFNNTNGNLRGQAIQSQNDIDQDPRFVDPDRHDYRLKQDSPCIKAGAGKADIGAYGKPAAQ